MNYEALITDLNTVVSALREFQEKHGMEIMRFSSKQDISAEENLIANSLTSIVDKMNGIRFITEKLQAPVKKEGTLSRDDEGRICLDGEPLKLLTDLEVLVDEGFNRGWTSSMIGMGEGGMFLVGIRKDICVDGLKARIR